eukprot:scaffold446752_cov33-Prasinocladus_malaysianus.AAC.1
MYPFSSESRICLSTQKAIFASLPFSNAADVDFVLRLMFDDGPPWCPSLTFQAVSKLEIAANRMLDEMCDRLHDGYLLDLK